jgi:PilZ domain-containing protein
MGAVAIFEKAQRSLGFDPSVRGHHVVYRTNESNRCPGCGRAQWYIGRMTAECGFCGTAVALAEVKFAGGGRRASSDGSESGQERRRHGRTRTADRKLQLMIDGSPHNFAVEDLSEGGAMGKDPIGMLPGTTLHVRFEGGVLVPAVVRWTEGDLVGLAFMAPLLLDLPASS